MSKIHVDPTTGHFVDEAGRVRMFRGVNSVKKESPWYHDILRNNTMVKSLADIGMNIVRLGNMWNGWQPHEPQHINTTYANILQVSTSNICNYLVGIYFFVISKPRSIQILTHYPWQEIVSNLEDNNIYTLLDVHQDVLWRVPEQYGNSYWGVPSWIKDKLVGNAKPFPWPFKDKLNL